MYSQLVLVLLTCLAGDSYGAAAYGKQAVCKSNPYAGYASLSNYGPAVHYCEGKYPKCTVYTTVKKTVTVTSTKGGYGYGYKQSRDAEPDAAADAAPHQGYGYSNAYSKSWDKLRKNKNQLHTFCSCLGYPQTKTRTLTYTKTVCIPKQSTTSSSTRATQTTSSSSTTTSSRTTTTSTTTTTEPTTTTTSTTTTSTTTTTTSTTTTTTTPPTTTTTTTSTTSTTTTTSPPPAGPTPRCTRDQEDYCFAQIRPNTGGERCYCDIRYLTTEAICGGTGSCSPFATPAEPYCTSDADCIELGTGDYCIYNTIGREACAGGSPTYCVKRETCKQDLPPNLKRSLEIVFEEAARREVEG
ncbi:hypothetical protein CB0940_09366 [Cercospora beticola]|uniref:Uncharacterized protein n=1 Tax=Cercospora beticola TaxID=122368 RepID=A0A2G5HHW3_CERBT|nr:hypothetical protein CB0940_09366 [Cercospora beticola]PIA92119.1 hypothetical protein CB0940_09366 [Cercospora beticola]WPB06319.1 hypothetical protein RHO25_010976 [Cercospora beticola]